MDGNHRSLSGFKYQNNQIFVQKFDFRYIWFRATVPKPKKKRIRVENWPKYLVKGFLKSSPFDHIYGLQDRDKPMVDVILESKIIKNSSKNSNFSRFITFVTQCDTSVSVIVSQWYYHTEIRAGALYYYIHSWCAFFKIYDNFLILSWNSAG